MNKEDKYFVNLFQQSKLMIVQSPIWRRNIISDLSQKWRIWTSSSAALYAPAFLGDTATITGSNHIIGAWNTINSIGLCLFCISWKRTHWYGGTCISISRSKSDLKAFKENRSLTTGCYSNCLHLFLEVLQYLTNSMSHSCREYPHGYRLQYVSRFPLVCSVRL